MANIAYQYSNGFDFKKVYSALTQRLGWLQPTIQDIPTLTDDNKKSISGRCFNDGSFHTLLSLKTILDSQEDNRITPEAFNVLLQNKVKAASTRAMMRVFNEVEYYDKQTLLYERNPRSTTSIPNTGLAIGYEINIPKRIDITAQILTAILCFDSDVEFNLYLFKDGKQSPVWQQKVAAVANEQTAVNLTDLYLNYANDSKGQKYYLVYFQSELGDTKAIQEQVYSWNVTHCIRCNPMVSRATGATFGINTISYSEVPCGLNLELYSFKDWTQDIIRRPVLFDELIGLTMAYMVMEESFYTKRSNHTERENKDELTTIGMQLDLTGVAAISQGPKTKGLAQRIDEEIKRVKKEFVPKNVPAIINLAEPCHYTQRQIL